MVNAESKVKAAQTAPNDSSTMAESCYGVPVSPQKWITVVRRWESPRNVWRDRRGRSCCHGDGAHRARHKCADRYRL